MRLLALIAMMIINPFVFGGAAVVGGLLFGWGDDTDVIFNAGTPSSSPIQVGSARWLSVVTSSNYGNTGGHGHSLGIQSDGSLWAWGTNAKGQLGDGSTTTRTSPVKIGALSWTVIACAGTGNTVSNDGGWSAGITTDGALFTWGENANGQLGDGTTVGKSSPVHVGTSSWNQVACGEGFGNQGGGHCLAIRTDGALFTWGRNNFGQLGDGATTDKSSPVAVGALSWKVVAAQGGRDNNMARSGGILTDGSLYMWGNGANGALGDGTAVSKSSPVHIGTSSFSLLAVGPHSLAIRIDGALFGWGYNNFGQIGDGTTTDRSSPVAIGSQSWKAISVNGGFSRGASIPGGWSGAIRTDGLLFTWGGNGSGDLGLGDTTSRSSPTQVGAATWLGIGVGEAAGVGRMYGLQV